MDKPSGNWHFLSMDSNLKQIFAMVQKQYDVAHWAVRIVDLEIDFDPDEILPASRIWIDGSPTNYKLPGTAGIAIDSDGNVAAELSGYAMACKKPIIMLIGGDEATLGEDDGELVIKDAFCYYHTPFTYLT